MIGVHQSRYAGDGRRVLQFRNAGGHWLPFSDTQCGFKLFQREAARVVFARQQLDGFGFDVEDLYIARVRGFRTVEVAVRWNNVEGTKVSLVNGLRPFFDLLAIRWYHLAGRYRQ